MELPAIAEQRRIADILDRADALRAKRRDAIALLDTLTQSIFIEMFGYPTANPRGWPQESLRLLGSRQREDRRNAIERSPRNVWR